MFSENILVNQFPFPTIHRRSFITSRSFASSISYGLIFFLFGKSARVLGMEKVVVSGKQVFNDFRGNDVISDYTVIKVSLERDRIDVIASSGIKILYFVQTLNRN